MINKLSNAVKYVDDTLVDMANVAVKAWNWTTGKTKVDLACNMQSAAAISEILGFYIDSPIKGSIFSPMNLFLSHIYQKDFRNTEERELRALDSASLDPVVEGNKFRYAFGGPIWFGVAGLTASSEFRDPSSPDTYLYSFGNALRGVSFYVMRSEAMPPRKNCISRGLDKLDGLVKKYKPQPTLVPELIERSRL